MIRMIMKVNQKFQILIQLFLMKINIIIKMMKIQQLLKENQKKMKLSYNKIIIAKIIIMNDKNQNNSTQNFVKIKILLNCNK